MHLTVTATAYWFVLMRGQAYFVAHGKPRIAEFSFRLCLGVFAMGQVKAACNKPGLVPKLEIIVVELEKCKKSLSEYLRFVFTTL